MPKPDARSLTPLAVDPETVPAVEVHQPTANGNGEGGGLGRRASGLGTKPEASGARGRARSISFSGDVHLMRFAR
ncbi:MAG TPA: hypothetical protein VGD77_05220 [Gemmatimonadaceae bacterium]